MKIFAYLKTKKEALFAFVPLAETPSGSKLGNLYTSTTDFSSFVNGAFKFALALGAILAVLRIAYAGYLYMGNDMWSKKGQAKDIIADVTLGLILLLAVYIILYQINPEIVKLDALKRIKPIPESAAGGGAGADSFSDRFGEFGAFDPANPDLSPCPAGKHDGGPAVSHACIPD